MRQIYRKKSRWQPARVDFELAVRVEVVELSRIAHGTMSLCVDFVPADGGEPMVRGGEDVRGGAQGWIGVHIVEKLLQVGVGVRDSGFRCWAIDAGLQLIEAVALVVLSSVGIA